MEQAKQEHVSASAKPVLLVPSGREGSEDEGDEGEKERKACSVTVSGEHGAKVQQVNCPLTINYSPFPKWFQGVTKKWDNWRPAEVGDGTRDITAKNREVPPKAGQVATVILISQM